MDVIVIALLVAVLSVAAWYAYRSYRVHSRASAERSRAALNRLLAEADEIQQRKMRERGIEPEQ